MSQTVATAAHCINSHCSCPYPQTMGNNFCNVCGAPLRLLHRYTPLQKLGVGGFAVIYTVWDEKTKKERVLKVLLETSPKALALFEQEATVLANLRHPGALGMTCIHLLTGKYPLDLEDPKTGDLHWQKITKISPSFASLLDDMIQPNIEKKPANANELLSCLRKINSQTIASTVAKALFQLISKLPANLFKLALGILGLFGQSITQTIVLFWKAIALKNCQVNCFTC